MSDNLSAAGLIPTVEPFTALGFTQIGGGGESFSPIVFSVQGGSLYICTCGGRVNGQIKGNRGVTACRIGGDKGCGVVQLQVETDDLGNITNMYSQ